MYNGAHGSIWVIFARQYQRITDIQMDGSEPIGTNTIENELVEVLHENHPMLDGDSGHLVVDAETKVSLVALTTHRSRHHNTIHFRTRYDVLELGTAFKLYGERRQEAVPEDISFRS